MPTIEDILAKVESYQPGVDLSPVRAAHAYAVEAQAGRVRLSGAPAIEHDPLYCTSDGISSGDSAPVTMLYSVSRSIGSRPAVRMSLRMALVVIASGVRAPAM